MPRLIHYGRMRRREDPRGIEDPGGREGGREEESAPESALEEEGTGECAGAGFDRYW